MQLRMIGLGRMGANIVRRLMRAQHRCVVFDQNADAVASLAAEGAIGATSFAGLVTKLAKPRTVLGDAAGGRDHRGDGDGAGGRAQSRRHDHRWRQYILKDDVRRARELTPKGIRYLDVGTSGGVWGLGRGYCLMIGGPKDAVDTLIRSSPHCRPGSARSNALRAATGTIHVPSAAIPRRSERCRPFRQDDPQRASNTA